MTKSTPQLTTLVSSLEAMALDLLVFQLDGSVLAATGSFGGLLTAPQRQNVRPYLVGFDPTPVPGSSPAAVVESAWGHLTVRARTIEDRLLFFGAPVESVESVEPAAGCTADALLHREFERFRRYDLPIAALWIELASDHADADRDSLMSQALERLRARLRVLDVIAQRPGGKGVVLLTDIEPQHVETIAGRICRDLQRVPYLHHDRLVRPEFRCGAVPGDAEVDLVVEHVIARARSAMSSSAREVSGSAAVQPTSSQSRGE